MKLLLPNSISSAQDIAGIILEIKAYGRWFSHQAILQRTTSKHTTEAPLLSQAASELLRACSAKQTLTQARLDELSQALQQFLKSAQVVTITLAAPPTGDVKQTLVAWCRTNISPQILVSFQFNQTLLGGMVVRYGSRIFDWSFRRQILAARDTFPEVLRRV
jgi:hypothetical protein